MRQVDEQIKNSNKLICKHIDNFKIWERGFLSQNILKNLRDLVEAVSVKAYGSNEYSYDIFKKKAKNYISARGHLKFLKKFHLYLQKTVSHYLTDEENSERLILKYYEYLLEIKNFLKHEYNFDVLENIEKFPINTDPLLQEYYEKIAFKINQQTIVRRKIHYKDRYYIRKIKPFFVNQKIYYEVTFTIANDNVSKFDRVIAFTQLNILPNYAVKLTVANDDIEIFGKKMPIQIIESWEVSIRQCELNNFADIFGKHSNISTGSIEARELMLLLKKTGLNLVEVVEFSDNYYQRFKDAVLKKAQNSYIFDILDEARKLIKNNNSGRNIIRYLLYNLNNKIIKLQFSKESCILLSNLNLDRKCIPFDKMPFISSLKGHNPKIYDLFDCIDAENREHELFARLIKNNTEQKGMLYTPVGDLDKFENIDRLINLFNNKLFPWHRPDRDLENYKNHIYINKYESDTLDIINRLKDLSKTGIKNYSNSVDAWLESTSYNIDCDNKKEILKIMFKDSKVVLIHGAAGTWKTRLIEHISNFFSENNKIFLANTNPAINNLQNRIITKNSTFKTISNFLSSNNDNTDCQILIIDECSTVSNSDMLDILRRASFKLLVLVGDVFQIESILFGNWFYIAQSLLPETSNFELNTPFRTKNKDLLMLWNKVRNIEDDILEHIINNKYSTELNESIFNYSEDDEIILCLNYDGLYGINNINRFLQGNNSNKEIDWGIHTYKIGDPILFNESNRFKPLIHNNLKGKIINFEASEEKIQFDIEIDKSINELDVSRYDDLEFLGESYSGKSIIRFSVNKLPNTDDDNESSRAVIPFQVAYAVSIHKAQGLEYNSVKVVITDEIEEMVTHNIFYTAITRAKEKLKIYRTPETEKKILNNLSQRFNKRDIHLLENKFNI